MAGRMAMKLHTIRPSVWVIVAALTVLAFGSALILGTETISAQRYLYVIQPMAAIAIYLAVRSVSHDHKDRVRHRGDKAFLVGSVLSVWFVLYFLTGLVVTYVNNSLVAGPKSILLNLWAFGVVAYALEYSRHRLMLLAGRRNLIWFGVLLSIILAVQQMNFGLIPHAEGLAGLIKLSVSDFVPAIVSSFLLTYLAVIAGFPAMLTYRLGLVAITILPPIIPKYDWYMQGVTLLLLAVATYIIVDRSRQDRQETKHYRRYHYQPERAYDITLVSVIIALALFMVGVFSYKPVAIASNSMQPVFSRGAMVLIEKVHNPMDVKVGDIVQYKRKDITITHRVVGIDAAADGSGERVFTTKGDNNPNKDQLVVEGQLVGIVRSQIPVVGYPSVWLSELSNTSRREQ